MPQAEVLARLGRPTWIFPVGWQKLQVWNYRFGGLEGDCIVFQVSISNATRTVTDAGTGTDPAAATAPNSRLCDDGEPHAQRACGRSCRGSGSRPQAASSCRSTNGRMPPCL